MVPASPVLIPCLIDGASRDQREGGVCGSGREGFANAMRGIIASGKLKRWCPVLVAVCATGRDFDFRSEIRWMKSESPPCPCQERRDKSGATHRSSLFLFFTQSSR